MPNELVTVGTAPGQHWRRAGLGLVAAALLAPPSALPQEAPAATDARRKRLADFAQSAPLHAALHRREYDRALTLMPHETDIDRVDAVYGLTPLGLAAKDTSADAIDMVKPLLLTYGADPNVPDRLGYTPLHHAAAAGNYAVVEALLLFGAEVDAVLGAEADATDPPPEQGGVTPLHLAYRRGRNRIADLLRAHGAAELAPELRRELELSGALYRAAERVRATASGDVRTATQMGLEALSRATEQTLSEQGRLEELAGWRQIRERLERVLLTTPVAPGESAREYMVRVSASLQDAQ